MRVEREKIEIPSGHSFRVLRWSRTLREVECVVAPGKIEKLTGEGTRWHFHMEMELTLFREGQGTRFVGDHIGAFEAGDLVLLGSKLPHYWHTRGHSGGLSVQWHFPEGHPFWAFPETLPLRGLFERAGHGLRLSGLTAARVGSLMNEMISVQGVEQLSLLLRVLAVIHAAPEKERVRLSARSFALAAESHYQQAISKAVRHLLASFREQVRLEDVLILTGMSRPTFARQFKKHSGKTLSEFLNHLRLQAACRELVESDRSVLEIALGSGFTQVSFFNRLFRRLQRCSPTEYRAKRRS
ncbi:helix-turn-helix domain-containing protein [Brevifollis gellanilyticus]|uniref:AraC family transcriptional regulator n=1 Tax=Brevifollis gellanilyticus TaxID=748831 RepID=A0A512MDV1_9BACT|nr:AraC family transcriptional regulator [Brevifollis gellanilyticus]GEP44909.1 AraC family transcriptional regulator [Brevifollis gellanilyticus]